MAAQEQKPNKKPLIIAPQTKIFFVALMLIAITKIIMFTTVGPVTPMGIFMFIYFVLTGIWGLVVVNCTVTGSCHVVAWIMSYVYLIISFFLAFMGMSVLYKGTM